MATEHIRAGAGQPLEPWGLPAWSLPFTYVYTYIRDGVMTFQRSMAVVPDCSDYAFGSVHLAPLATALPGQQETADMIFNRLLHSEFVGFGQPATVLGPLYVHAGLAVVKAGMAAGGIGAREAHR